MCTQHTYSMETVFKYEFGSYCSPRGQQGGSYGGGFMPMVIKHKVAI